MVDGLKMFWLCLWFLTIGLMFQKRQVNLFRLTLKATCENVSFLTPNHMDTCFPKTVSGTGCAVTAMDWPR